MIHTYIVLLNNYICRTRCDVTKQIDWENLWKHTEQEFGGKVELLVNNAGLNPELLSWRTSLDVMLYGVMLGTFMARDKMAATKVRMHTRILRLAPTIFPIEILYMAV